MIIIMQCTVLLNQQKIEQYVIANDLSVKSILTDSGLIYLKENEL